MSDALQTECKENHAFSSLLATVRRLRGEGGCPWDRAQTHETLRRYLIEETYEVIEAIDNRDPEGLREELGDLLLQVLFHAEIESEQGNFDIGDVAADENRKMVQRHPHVFSDASADEVLASWEASKSREKARLTLGDRLSSVPRALPALLRAQKLLEKCEGQEKSLLPVPAGEAIRALSETAEEEILLRAGEILLSTVEALRAFDIDCEAALTHASDALLQRAKGLKNP